MNDLIDAVNVARHWCSKNGFPKNPVTRRLRSQEFIEHRGVKLKNAHRSANDLCDFLMGIIATQKYKRILEIGTLFGFSTLHLAEAAALNNGRVTTIDLRVRKRTWVTGETVEDIHELALKYADESDLAKRIVFMSGRSETILAQQVLDGERFDLVFIDGSHSKYVVILDLINALNLLTPNGLIVFDDVSQNVALREYNHGGPNSLLPDLLASQNFDMLALSYNTMVLRPKGERMRITPMGRLRGAALRLWKG